MVLEAVRMWSSRRSRVPAVGTGEVLIRVHATTAVLTMEGWAGNCRPVSGGPDWRFVCSLQLNK
jgi:hypothetical protein